VTCGELPEDRVEEGALAVDALAGALSNRRPKEPRSAPEDAVMFTHDLDVGSFVARGVAREAPSVGSYDHRRLTADKVVIGIRWNEGLKKRPLVLGEISGQMGVIGREG